MAPSGCMPRRGEPFLQVLGHVSGSAANGPPLDQPSYALEFVHNGAKPWLKSAMVPGGIHVDPPGGRSIGEVAPSSEPFDTRHRRRTEEELGPALETNWDVVQAPVDMSLKRVDETRGQDCPVMVGRRRIPVEWNDLLHDNSDVRRRNTVRQYDEAVRADGVKKPLFVRTGQCDLYLASHQMYAWKTKA